MIGEFTMCKYASHMTLKNLISPTASSSNGIAQVPQKCRPRAAQYSALIVEDILSDIFAEQRGDFTSGDCEEVCCKPAKVTLEPEPYVDKRLRYWREVLEKRKEMQKRVQSHAKKSPDEVLFNRPVTVDHRDEQTVKRLLDYAHRMKPDKLAGRMQDKLKGFMDPCTCECIEDVDETLPKAERHGHKQVEIVGLPNVTKKELLGRGAASRDLPRGWQQSKVLNKRLEKGFCEIHKVLEFFPDLDGLQVVGKNINISTPKPTIILLDEASMHTISTSSDKVCLEECQYEDWDDLASGEPEPCIEVPELALRINGKEFIPGDISLSDCYEIATKFSCDPFQRQVKHILQVTNTGKQTITFTWTQGVYYYNRGSLLLPEDNEFLFDMEGFRLTHGETYNLIVMYQPRRVAMAMELWKLKMEPRIFCGNQESLLLRFHGQCTPPRDYVAKLKQLQTTLIHKSNTAEMNQLTAQLASLIPVTVPPPTCCPYDRTLDEREVFNALNPGYNCKRFDDLEVLKHMHKQVKKPREPHWDLRLETIKEFILRLEKVEDRENMFTAFTTLLSTLLGGGPSLDIVCQLNDQKQRTRFIYVRGVISNGIEEWEDLVFTVEESFFKPELQRHYMRLLQEGDERQENDVEEEEDDEDDDKERLQHKFIQIDQEKIFAFLAKGNVDQEKVSSTVMKKLKKSKYFRDALYIQTYTHLCNISENIVSVIESTEFVPN
ncbi:uncharacterized protein Dwil_GK21794 [Drosophila willistoni]|uniref:GK21794 n=2 Tax=Drosophila willistoni TaxID=7260 RepID=B4MPY3_DROWI|nr:uncharacterized protein Dwil_GK21794 [Drosophila willistoni]